MKSSVLSVLALAAAMGANAAVVATPADFTTSANADNQNLTTFAAQSGPLTVSFDLLFTGTLSTNDFAVVWLDTVATGGHTSVPNIGLKADEGVGPATKLDYLVRDNAAAYASTQAVSGTSVNLLAYINPTTAKLSLWVNPTAGEKSSLTGWDAQVALSPAVTAFTTLGIRTATLSGGDTVKFSNIVVTAVPEPGTYAMLLAGLAAVGFVAKRRTS